MMDQKRSMYSAGWDNSIQLKCNFSNICEYIINKKEEMIKITCENTMKKMTIKKTSQNEERDWIEDGMELLKGVELDISDDGDRWEGDVLNEKPFGFGCYYNDNNRLVYS